MYSLKTMTSGRLGFQVFQMCNVFGPRVWHHGDPGLGRALDPLEVPVRSLHLADILSSPDEAPTSPEFASRRSLVNPVGG